MAFAFYTPFPVDHTKVGAGDSSNFPVGIIVTDARFKTIANAGHVANASGFDLRPYADTTHTSALTYQLESYDGTTGAVVMWVNVSTLSHTADTPIYLFYGDAALNSDGGSTGVWDANFQAVYHLDDNAASTVVAESTVNALSTASVRNTSLMSGAGIIGTALQFNGTTDHAQATSVLAGVSGKAATFTTWAKISVFDAAGTMLWGTNTGASVFYQIASTLAVWVNGASVTVTSTPFADGAWRKITMICDSAGNTKVRVNGATIGTGSGGVAFAAGAKSFGLGDWIGGYNTNFSLSGSMDEARFSSTNRSDDWDLAEYNNQNAPTTFAPIGTEVPLGGSSGVLQLTTLQSTMYRPSL